MDTRRIIWLFMLVGSVIGGMLPVVWGGSELSFSSVLLGGLGGILGIYIGFKLTR